MSQKLYRGVNSSNDAWITAEATQTYDIKQLYSGVTYVLLKTQDRLLKLNEIFKDPTIALYKRGRSLKIC